jgi:BON domain-containing protein
MRRLIWGLAVAALIACGPSGVRADDLEVAQQVAENLRTSGLMKGYSVGVKVLGGSALLRGKVANEEQRQTALYIARQTEGVEQVMDELTIATADGPGAGTGAGANTRGRKALLASNRSTSAPVGGNPRAQNAGNNGPMPRGFAPSGQLPPQTQVANRAAATFPRHHGYRDHGNAGVEVAPSMETVGPGIGGPGAGGPVPAFVPGIGGGGVTPARYDQPYLPKHAWPAYAAYPNYGAVTYPMQYSPTAWPYIGPFYPYPQVPLGWRKVTLEWDDGWWFLDFKARRH